MKTNCMLTYSGTANNHYRPAGSGAPPPNLSTTPHVSFEIVHAVFSFLFDCIALERRFLILLFLPYHLLPQPGEFHNSLVP
jgi:hypothetical protein